MNLKSLPPAVAQSIIKTIRREDAAQYALGVIEQRKLKKLYDNLAVPGFNTDLGRQTMCLSRGQWYQALRDNNACFQDPDFAKFLLKHHEEFRVKDVGTRIQSGFTGLGFTAPAGKPPRANAPGGAEMPKPTTIIKAGKYARLTETA